HPGEIRGVWAEAVPAQGLIEIERHDADERKGKNPVERPEIARADPVSNGPVQQRETEPLRQLAVSPGLPARKLASGIENVVGLAEFAAAAKDLRQLRIGLSASGDVAFQPGQQRLRRKRRPILAPASKGG